MARGLFTAAYVLGPLAFPLAAAAAHSALGGETAEYGAKPIVDRLHEDVPRMLQTSLGRAVQMASQPLATAGLSLDELIDTERTLQQEVLAPQGVGTERRAPKLLIELADGKINDQVLDHLGLQPPGARELQRQGRRLSPFPAYVYTVNGDKEEAAKLQDRFNHTYEAANDVNPYLGTRFEVAWEQLESAARNGQMPVYVDLDGDHANQSTTEQLITRTVQSLVERDNSLGDSPSEPQSYYRWLVKRVQQQAKVTRPWLEQTSPEVIQASDRIKKDLEPMKPSLVGRLRNTVSKSLGLPPIQYPMFWKADPVHARDAYERVLNFLPEEKDDLATKGRFADLLISLDRDLHSGVQTHWIRLLRQLTPRERSRLLEGVAATFVDLNLASSKDADYDQVAPSKAPPIKQYLTLPDRRQSDGKLRRIPYDRSQGLAEVIDHAMDGLGVEERREFTRTLRRQVTRRLPSLRTRERALAAKLDNGYSLPLQENLNESRAERTLIHVGLAKLGTEVLKFHLNAPGSSREHGLACARHLDLMALIHTKDTRYGDPLALLSRETRQVLSAAPDREGAVNALGVGEMYESIGAPRAEPPKPVQKRPTETVSLGEGPRTAVSIVLEGGGGKGFCYVECLRQTRDAMKASRQGRFEIDEFVGTSAGAITAGLLASGFAIDDLSEVMESLDFKKFFSDYAWNQGGVDPKARGIHRTGMFSTQKMYRDLHRLMADKLKIYNRPILFRDLPRNLKVVTTVMNTDLPQDHPLRDKIGPDGELVLDAQTTPNLDVVAAMTASAAIPGVFSAPQLLVENGTDQPYRLQLVDGGVVNNFPVARATQDEDGTTALAVLPARYGELKTLDFDADPDKLSTVDSKTRELYGGFMPQLVETLNQARSLEGTQRVVLGYNLSRRQGRPILQSATRMGSQRLVRLAQSVGMPCLTPEQASTLIQRDLPHGPPPMGARIAQIATDLLLDTPANGSIEPGRYHPSKNEFGSLSEVIAGAAGAGMAARYDRKLFERPQE